MWYYILVCIVLLTLITYSIRYVVRNYYEKKIIETNAAIIHSHVEEVESIYRQMRGWRHDYKNHIQAMKAYLEMNQIDQIKGYLNELDEDLMSVDTLIKSGNVTVDAVLNSKLTLAQSKEIVLNAKAQVPKSIQILDVDLGVILGNLLNNAVEGCLTVDNPQDRFIRVYIQVMKEQLYISVTNSMNRQVKKIGKQYITTKSGKDHGFGLLRIDNTVEKYGGYINRQSEEGVFATEVMLPL